jgi:hypothetical protein
VALSLGDFWGIKIGGRLIAMAGERMKQPGYTELSGVCTHPDFRGKGLGGRFRFTSRTRSSREVISLIHTLMRRIKALSHSMIKLVSEFDAS